jgi:hypothetical protein
LLLLLALVVVVVVVVGLVSVRSSHELRVGRLRFDSRQGKVFSSQCPDRFWGPPTYNPIGTGGAFLRVKRLGGEAEHSPLSSVEVKTVRLLGVNIFSEKKICSSVGVPR